MTRDKLTALVPVHNDDYALSLCLASIVGHFDEVLVLDDCSTDNTPEVALDVARRHPHVRFFRHEGTNQLGWIAARNALLAQTDSDLLFWIDSDDVLCQYNAGLLREIAAGPHVVVRLQLCEMWGDLGHTTQRLRHYDRCHLFVNRRRDRDFIIWRGGTMADPNTTVRLAHQGPGPLFFHIKGVKPDRRLVERAGIRLWLCSGQPGRLEDFVRLGEMSEEEVHARAVRMLLTSKQDHLRRWGSPAPRRPEVIERAPRRFEMVYVGGRPVDRIDHGWAPPGAAVEASRIDDAPEMEREAA